jgi:hypothetical protein
MVFYRRQKFFHTLGPLGSRLCDQRQVPNFGLTKGPDEHFTLTDWQLNALCITGIQPLFLATAESRDPMSIWLSVRLSYLYSINT